MRWHRCHAELCLLPPWPETIFHIFPKPCARKASSSVNEKRQLNTQQLFEDPTMVTMVSWSLDKPSFRTSNAIGTWLKIPGRSGQSPTTQKVFSDLLQFLMQFIHATPLPKTIPMIHTKVPRSSPRRMGCSTWPLTGSLAPITAQSLIS